VRIPLAAVTDEFSTTNLDVALAAMAEAGMTGVELRVVSGKSIVDHTDAEIDAIVADVRSRGMTVLSIASPVLKCVLPDAPSIDPRFQQDVFGATYTIADQPHLTARTFEIARRTGARIVRVFSYWRTVDPDACFVRVCHALRQLADEAQRQGLIVGLENEHACNIATAAESARLLAAVDHPALQLIWDPANAYVVGEVPYPDGYALLPKGRIVHVHAKDCRVDGQKPIWGELGKMDLDWKGQIAALQRDGYRGSISLETHWRGPDGDRLAASKICARALADMVSEGAS